MATDEAHCLHPWILIEANLVRQCFPNIKEVIRLKPNKAEYKELAEFKKRVWLELYNAIQLEANCPGSLPYEVKIGNATFKLHPIVSSYKVDKHMQRFTTTRW